MVKRDDAMETSQGSARDTDSTPASASTDPDAGSAADLQEGWYKPEMGTVLIDRIPLDDEA